ncbi:MAG: universal stress protein [Bacteroidota bacterium]
MDTIIVTTDFSKNADNALNYATELAKLLGATITLLYIDSISEKANGNSIQQSETTIQSNDKNIKMELCIRSGQIDKVISETVKKKSADLIIIGISETGVFEDTILGGNAVDIIRNSAAPILIIPAKAKFKIPTKMVFATDYIELKNDQPLFALLNFVTLFKSKLFIVNVMKEDEKTSSKKVAAIINVKKVFNRVALSFYYPYNDDVVSGINEFVSETDSDIVAMIPHKHNVFYRLFNLSQTRKMIFHSNNVPILALPENMPLHELETVTEMSYKVYSITDQINIF